MNQIIPKKEDCYLCNASGFIKMIEIDEWNTEFCYESLCPCCCGQKVLNWVIFMPYSGNLPKGKNLSIEG